MVLPGKGISWKEFLTELSHEYKKDKVNDVAAGLTYYGVLALFPFLLFLVSLAGLIIGPGQIEQLVGKASAVVPEQATVLLRGWLTGVAQSSGRGLLSFGILAALWAASSGVAATMRAMNTAYDVQEGRPFWLVRAIALGVALGGAVLALVATLVMVAAPAFLDRLVEPIGTVLMWVRLPVAGLLMAYALAVAYWVLPDVEQRKFRFITPGSVFAVVVWLIASWLFSLYVRYFGHYEATYGALGGAIVMLLWMWISAQVVVLGAEINALLEHKSPEGKRKGAKSASDTNAAPKAEGPAMHRPPERGEEPRHFHERGRWHGHGPRHLH